MRRLAIAAALIALAVGPALAQAPPAGTPTRIRGTVDKLDGQTLTVKSREGPVLTIALAPNFRIAPFGPGDASLLKPGAAVWVGAQKASDGSWTAARGTAEKDGVKPPM